jgi:hypothetical protein
MRFRLRRQPDTAVRDAVLKLWDGNDAWIPGGDYKRLADALGVPHERTQTWRQGGQSKPPGRNPNIPIG